MLTWVEHEKSFITSGQANPYIKLGSHYKWHTIIVLSFCVNDGVNSSTIILAIL